LVAAAGTRRKGRGNDYARKGSILQRGQRKAHGVPS
jgi:hypothetical protein